MPTSRQPEVARRPSSQEYTSCTVSTCCCCTNVCRAVRKDAIVTPASTKAAGPAAAPAERPGTYAATAATAAPAPTPSALAPQRLSDGAHEIDDAWAPTRGH